MECPYCGAELIHEDSYGTKEYIIYGDENYKNGDIYRCPNHEGFDNQTEAENYAKLNNIEYENWEDIICDSSMSGVSGSFYTDRQGNLYDGYPC